MTIEIIIPHMGETTTQVKIARWLKAVGEYVEKGEPLLEVETDKATLEIESFGEGTLQRILVPEGGEADAMHVVAILGNGEAEDAAPPEAASPIEATRERLVQASPVAQRVAVELDVVLEKVTGTGKDGRIKAEDVRRYHEGSCLTPPPRGESQISGAVSPKARRLAKEAEVDLTGISGSGPDGLITAEDIQRAIQAPSAGKGRIELSRLRQTIAARMSGSKGSIPHFYLFTNVDMLECQRLRAHSRDQLGWERPPTYTDLIISACARALSTMPEVNIRYQGAALVQHNGIHIGIAVGVQEGLLVPIIKDVDRLSLTQLAAQSEATIERARKGRLKEDDLGEKSMVVSNLGMEGVDAFVAIIDPPDPMILAVGKVGDRVVPIEGQPAVRPMCTLVLSIDHRALDGVIASRFLMLIKGTLEDPLELLEGDER